MEMLQLNEDEVRVASLKPRARVKVVLMCRCSWRQTDGQEDPLGWHMHDHSAHAKQLIRDLDTHDWMSREWEPPSVAAVRAERGSLPTRGPFADVCVVTGD